MFVQNIIKRSEAVHESSCTQTFLPYLAMAQWQRFRKSGPVISQPISQSMRLFQAENLYISDSCCQINNVLLWSRFETELGQLVRAKRRPSTGKSHAFTSDVILRCARLFEVSYRSSCRSVLLSPNKRFTRHRVTLARSISSSGSRPMVLSEQR